jgi:hypothetical protein
MFALSAVRNCVNTPTVSARAMETVREFGDRRNTENMFDGILSSIFSSFHHPEIEISVHPPKFVAFAETSSHREANVLHETERLKNSIHSVC